MTVAQGMVVKSPAAERCARPTPTEADRRGCRGRPHWCHPKHHRSELNTPRSKMGTCASGGAPPGSLSVVCDISVVFFHAVRPGSSFRIDSRWHSKALCFTPSFSYSRPRSSPSTCTWARLSSRLPRNRPTCRTKRSGAIRVRDSHAPSEFFHERCVATENAVKVDPLLIVFVSGVSADESDEGESVEVHGRFSCSARMSWALKSWRPPLPRQGSCFLWGDQNWGS